MGLPQLARAARRAINPLFAALVVAALGVTTAFLVLAMRGHFSAAAGRAALGSAAAPPSQATPAAPTSSAPSPTALPTGPQSVTGTLGEAATIRLSSDNADSVTIQAGTPVNGTVVDDGGQLTVVDLVVGQAPTGKHKRDISGSAATAATLTVATPAGPVTLAVLQDSVIAGNTDERFALEITRPGR